MRAKTARGLEALLKSFPQLTGIDRAEIMEAVSTADASVSGLRELEARLAADRSPTTTQGILRAAATAIRSDMNGEPDPWALEEETPERDRMDAFAAAAEAERLGNVASARRIREAIAAFDAEQDAAAEAASASPSSGLDD